MTQRSWEQAFREEVPKLKALAAEALDDIRHKVVEQGWSGKDQTGYLQSPYGNTSSGVEHTNQTSATTPEDVNIYSTIDSKETYVRFAPEGGAGYPTEDEGWWLGEYDGSYDGNSNIEARNGWELGQDTSPSQFTPQEQTALEQQELQNDFDRGDELER